MNIFGQNNRYNPYGNSNRQNFNLSGRIRDFFNTKSMLSKLIAINIAVWILVLFVDLFCFLFKIQQTSLSIDMTNKFVYWLSIPADVNEFIRRPWTVLTYMFVHQQFFHIFFNMLVLYSAGRIFNQFFSDKKLLWTYIIGGLFGALFFMISYNVFPVFESQINYSVAIGASASVMAILFAIAAYVPNLEVNLWLIGTIKFKWLAVIFIIIDMLSISNGNAGGHLAHLGGALWGLVFGLLSKSKTHHAGENIFSKIKRSYYTFKSKQTFNKNKKHLQKQKQEEIKRKVAEQKKIDEILSKISLSGYSSLTKEEKEIIFSNSKK